MINSNTPITFEYIDRLRRELREDITDTLTISASIARLDGAIRVCEEKFNSIYSQIKDLDSKSESSREAARLRSEAAIQSLKEASVAQNTANTTAINKSESSTTSEINGLHTLINTTTESINKQINEIKDSINVKLSDLTARMDRSESFSVGIRDNRNETRLNTGHIFGMIGGAVAILSLLLAYNTANHSNSLGISTPNNSPLTLTPTR